MTPAKLQALSTERFAMLELESLPVDKLTCTYVNLNRDPGEKDKDGNIVRPPADVIPFSVFKTFGGKSKAETLAANSEDDWDYALQGAKAVRTDWEQWTDSKYKRVVVPHRKE
jgi:hypothetical protein